MTTKVFIQKLNSGYLWKNILLMAGVVVLMVIAMGLGTSLYTHHGEVISVPDIRNKKFADAERLLDDAGLIIVVTDTGYNRQLPPDCILQQQPAPGSEVKSGRMIYVTINASQKPTLTLPDIIDNSSMREATAKLRILGFKLGDPQFVPGEKDWVYGVKCRGRNLVAGDAVPLDVMITLVVGNGALDEGANIEYTDPEYLPMEEEEVEPVTETNPEEDPFQVVE